MRLAILIDTSDGTKPAITQLRSAVADFLDALPPGQEVLLVSTGRHVQVRVPPTTDYEKVRKSAKGLVTDGGPTPLADALVEIDRRFMRGLEGRSPVFVVVTGDGSESSVEIDAFNAWLQTLRGRLTVDAVLMKTGNGVPEAMIRAVTQAAHGQLDVVGTSGGVVEKLAALGHSFGSR
jgi:Mg-chelatase subunit ChlD